jgi:protein-tyrosine-phosphatase
MNSPVYHLLFVCVGNSARSILAECLMNHLGGGKFRAWSAGSRPRGEIHPQVIATLEHLRIPHEGARSKSWDEFSRLDSPELDFVITVCNEAAGEECPVWPGQPMTAHWEIADPAVVHGSADAEHRAFVDAAVSLKRRIELLLSLPLQKLDALSLHHKLREIGHEERATASH